MEIMYIRKTGERVEVYGFDVDHMNALCYNTNIASNSNGNGWQVMPTKKLIPEAYVNKADGTYMSKTERNDVKSHLKLVDAVWQCTDGLCFTHKNIEGAINHQRELLNNEEEN